MVQVFGGVAAWRGQFQVVVDVGVAGPRLREVGRANGAESL